MRASLFATHQVMHNWSGTMHASTDRFYAPSTQEQVELLVAQAHEQRRTLRAVGAALSPNGMALSEEGMISCHLLRRVLWIDEAKKLVRVEAGATVAEVLAALEPHGLTLAVLASIQEQSIAGFTQSGAHGTGVRIPPAEQLVHSMKIVTPGLGTVELSEESSPDLFKYCKLGLGAFGVLTEITLHAVPRTKLLEFQLVLTRRQAEALLPQLLRDHRHVRYLWIPYRDAVVAIYSSPCDPSVACVERQEGSLEALESLVAQLGASPCDSVSSCRESVLQVAPLSTQVVQRLAEAEESYWRSAQGIRVDWNEHVLQFDCGGQQLVCELAFDADHSVDFMRQLLEVIERENIPAPSPIEQRWSAGSSAPMSVAFGDRPVSWVGIIMYLSAQEQRQDVVAAFERYCRSCGPLWLQFGASVHWAKYGGPRDAEERLALHSRFPLDQFNAVRRLLDPHGVMGNAWLRFITGDSLR